MASSCVLGPHRSMWELGSELLGGGPGPFVNPRSLHAIPNPLMLPHVPLCCPKSPCATPGPIMPPLNPTVPPLPLCYPKIPLCDPKSLHAPLQFPLCDPKSLRAPPLNPSGTPFRRITWAPGGVWGSRCFSGLGPAALPWRWLPRSGGGGTRTRVVMALQLRGGALVPHPMDLPPTPPRTGGGGLQPPLSPCASPLPGVLPPPFCSRTTRVPVPRPPPAPFGGPAAPGEGVDPFRGGH